MSSQRLCFCVATMLLGISSHGITIALASLASAASLKRKSQAQTRTQQSRSPLCDSAPLACLHTDFVWVQDMDVPAAIKDADSTREAQLLESWKAYKKGFQEGIALFNKKPKKGIAFMQVCCQVCCVILSSQLHAITFLITQLSKLLMFPLLFPCMPQCGSTSD